MPREFTPQQKAALTAACVHELRQFFVFCKELPDPEQGPETLQTRTLRSIVRNPEAILSPSDLPFPKTRAMAGGALLFSPALFEEAWTAQLKVLQELEARICGVDFTEFLSVRVAPLAEYKGGETKGKSLSVYYGEHVLTKGPLSVMRGQTIVGRHATVTCGETEFCLMIPPARFVVDGGTRFFFSRRRQKEGNVLSANNGRVFGMELDCGGRVNGFVLSGDSVHIQNNRIREPLAEPIVLRASSPYLVTRNIGIARKEDRFLRMIVDAGNSCRKRIFGNVIRSLEPVPVVRKPLKVLPYSPRPLPDRLPEGHEDLLKGLRQMLAELKTTGDFSRKTDLRIFCPRLPMGVRNAQLALLQKAHAQISGIPLDRFRKVACFDLDELDLQAPRPFPCSEDSLVVVHGNTPFITRPLFIEGVTLVGGNAVLEIEGKDYPIWGERGLFRVDLTNADVPDATTRAFFKRNAEKLTGFRPSFILEQANLLGIDFAFAIKTGMSFVGKGDMILAHNRFHNFDILGFFALGGGRVRIDENRLAGPDPEAFRHSGRGLFHFGAEGCREFYQGRILFEEHPPLTDAGEGW